MTKIQNPKPVYDLEERTFQFAKAVRFFVKTLPKTIANIPARHLPARALHWQAGCQALAGGEDGKQLIKASGSVGAKLQTCFGH
jgi:hypothetical protein